MRKIFLVFISTIFIIGLAGCTSKLVEGEMTEKNIVELAQCLGDKGVKMYGSVGCGHCQKQKDAFGDAFKYINYVECNPNVNIDTARECQAAGIIGVPSWDFPDGNRKTGKTSLPEIAELAGC